MGLPLRNPIHQLKLTLLQRLMVLSSAAFCCGHTTTVFRQQQDDGIALHTTCCHLYETAHRGNRVKATET